MIESGWAYVAGAYAATLIGLGALVLTAHLRAHYWARRARELDKTR
mgnify:CR=1 FL=1